MRAAAMLVAACLLWSPAAWSQKPSVPIMKLSDVKVGMKATGRTIYEGEEIESFDAEILGVMPGAWGPGEDIIVARLLGPNAKRYGVAAGMSGSPVYVDGKLIGALSLAYGGFQREPIAGITPIESMLRVRSEAARERHGAQYVPPSNVKGGQLVPVRTPLVLSGVDPRAMPIVAEWLAPYGLAVSGAAGSGGSKKTGKTQLRPGGAVAGVLARGDISVQGVGTVTYVDDRFALAFGHAFLLYGNVEMPMATARVITTVPSNNLSFKVAYADEVVGTIVRDNKTAIAGRIGKSASMIPVQLEIRSLQGEARKLDYEVFRNKTLTPLVVGIGLVNGMTVAADFDAEGSTVVESTIRVEDHPDLVFKRIYFDKGPQGSLIPLIANDVGSLMQSVLQNPLASTKIQSIAMTLTEVGGRQEARIEGAWVDTDRVRAGDTIEVRVRVRPYQQDAYVRTVRLTAPAGTPKGEIEIVVTGADPLEANRKASPTGRGSTDLKYLIDEFNQRRVDDAVYVQMNRKAPGVLLRGVEMDALPPSVLSVIKPAAPGDAGLDTAVLAEGRIPVDARVVGEVKLKLRVQ